MPLLPEITLSETEQDEVIKHLSEPVVKRYLTMLATGIASDLLTASPTAGESDSEFIRRQQSHRGGLATLNTLLSISKE